MSKHMNGWLAAYHDGELGGRKLKQVEEHLKECEECRTELKELRSLSALLQESPAASDLTPADRFVAQVGLQLPRRQAHPVWQRAARLGWQFAPVGLLGAWAFIQSALVVTLLLVVAQRFGFVENLAVTLGQSSVVESVQTGTFAAPANFLDNLGQFVIGSLGVGSLFGFNATLKIALPVVIGLLYLIWLASWWGLQHRNDLLNKKA